MGKGWRQAEWIANLGAVPVYAFWQLGAGACCKKTYLCTDFGCPASGSIINGTFSERKMSELTTMPVLHNRVSNEELKQHLMDEAFERRTISFYQYFPIQNPQEFRDHLYKNLDLLNIFGRIYVAKEGINAQISVPAEQLKHLQIFFIRSHR